MTTSRRRSARPYAPRAATVEAFTAGDCWHLALVLHRRTGWPMLFTAPDFDFDRAGDPDYWEHVGVLMPDGRVMDVGGAVPRAQWEQEWGTRSRVVHDEEVAVRIIELDKKWGSEHDHRLYTVNTHTVARRLLQAHAHDLIAL